MQTATDLEFSPFSSESPYYHKQIANNCHLDPVEMQTDTVNPSYCCFIVVLMPRGSRLQSNQFKGNEITVPFAAVAIVLLVLQSPTAVFLSVTLAQEYCYLQV